MATRRQFSLFLLSLVSAVTVSVLARNTRLLAQTRLPVEIGQDKLNLAGSEVNDTHCCVLTVIGVGGRGIDAVEHMIRPSVDYVSFICADTDARALKRSTAQKIIQLGASGIGAGGKPDKGREAAEAAEADIREAIQGAHILFIAAGMGGGTGTGAAPIISRLAREMGILTVGVVTKPFDFEGSRRISNADAGLAELEANIDSLIVVPNEKLLEVLGDDISQEQAISTINDLLKDTVNGIAGIVNVPGHVGIDLEDVRTVIGKSGIAMLGTGVAEGPDRSRLAAERAMACPMTECLEISTASGVFVMISAAKGSLRLSESKYAMNTIRTKVSTDAQVIYGTVEDDGLGEKIRVTVIACPPAKLERPADKFI